MSQKDITFISDGYRLTGTLHLPGTDDPPVVIGSHGLLSSAGSPKQIALADKCVDAGIAYLRFDHRGCGNSEGDFKKDTSLKKRCTDIQHAMDFLKANGLSCGRIGLFGSSMGGAICISMATRLSVNVMVINAAPVKLDQIRSIPEIPDSLPTDLRFDLSRNLKHLHHTLIFHGDADEVVPPDQAHLIYEHAQEPKRLVMLQNGDHEMSNPEHQQVFIEESVLWFREYLIDIPEKS